MLLVAADPLVDHCSCRASSGRSRWRSSGWPLRFVPESRIRAAGRSPSFMLTWNLLMPVATIVLALWWLTRTDLLARLTEYFRQLQP